MNFLLPSDYSERVYAGVLGKLIGVYLGRPFEGWTYERIMRELGEVNDYVNDRMSKRPPLVVTDDDISGTFTFLRALPDYGNRRELTAEQIGQTWLNYLIERQTILWWGGMGNSTEHTAYIRLKQGIPAPRSGSMALNGRVVAEQIGAQIFIDGWGMVAPGQPALAAELARKAASVSHDGEAIHAAVVVATMVAQAFVERNMDKLFETGLSFIPRDSLVTRLINDVRNWCTDDEDWHRTRARIAEKYGYDQYGGNCHVIPNHAIIIMALAYASDDFQRALLIANTAGWDTDCNSGNVGCLLGIKNGLVGIDRSPVRWRAPVADRLYLPTADGGRAISDAVQEAYRVVQIGHALSNNPYTPPKQGARFSFALPGSVQGFRSDEVEVRLENLDGRLAIRHAGQAHVGTPTFVPPDARVMPGNYALIASPTLYAGQTITAAVSCDVDAKVGLFVRVYGADDRLEWVAGETKTLRAGETQTLQWTLPTDGAAPIAEVGVQAQSAERGTLWLDWLTWAGAPTVKFTRPQHNGTLWRRAWVTACDDVRFDRDSALRIMQDEGVGLLIQGEREWTNYRASATIVPHLAKAAGIAVCVQGLRRYYALSLCDDQQVRLVKALDGQQVLAEKPFAWALDGAYALSLTVHGNRLRAAVNDHVLFDVTDAERPLEGGAVALLIEAGRLDCEGVAVQAIS